MLHQSWEDEETLIKQSRTGRRTLRGEAPPPSPWVGAQHIRGTARARGEMVSSEARRGPTARCETMLTESCTDASLSSLPRARLF